MLPRLPPKQLQTPMLEEDLYERGKCFEMALNNKNMWFKILNHDHMDPEVSAELTGDGRISKMDSWAPYVLWGSYLSREGRRIDEKLDELLLEIRRLNDSWYDKTRPLKSSTEQLLAWQRGIRNLEADVEEYLNAIAARSLHDFDARIFAVTSILANVHATFDRAYELALTKWRQINQSRATYVSIALSLTAALVALLALFSSS